MSRNGMRFWQKWKRPTGWRLVLIYTMTLLTSVGAILVAVWQKAPLWVSLLGYFLYGTAAVGVGYSVYTLVIYIPGLKGRIIDVMKRHRFTARLLENYGFRTVMEACLSLIGNLGYAVFNGVVAIVSRSVWYGALATYYILLTLLRSRLILHHRKLAKGNLEDERAQRRSEISRYRMCGAVLVAMPLCLSAAIVQMIVADQGYSYGELTIYVVAAYTFFKITRGIMNAVRARQNPDLTVKALRNVGLADAMVSVLALQTAMFDAFGGELNTDLANALTGAGVCAVTVCVGIYMLIKAKKERNENK
ncbi:MAG: hypothetical protein IJY22_08285 [Clostridia bacterium]|nr:hypothetical protein [Clostridia bacterium]